MRRTRKVGAGGAIHYGFDEDCNCGSTAGCSDCRPYIEYPSIDAAGNPIIVHDSVRDNTGATSGQG